MSETVQNLTSPESWQQKLGQWAKTKGLAQMMGTGLDMGSTIGRSAMFDQSTAQGRQIALEDMALRQKYLDATQMQGGIDPGSLVAAQQAAKGQNQQGLQEWQRGVLSGAQGLGQTAQDAINRSMGNIQSAHTANTQAALVGAGPARVVGGGGGEYQVRFGAGRHQWGRSRGCRLDGADAWVGPA